MEGDPKSTEEEIAADGMKILMSEEMSSNDEGHEATNEIGMSLEEFIEHVRVEGHEEYAEIKARAASVFEGHEEYAEIKARAASGFFTYARSTIAEQIAADRMKILMSEEISIEL